jgi:8-oxo-dGTP pyrophosphatase MutT (NUDIX family)/thymidylate kinase
MKENRINHKDTSYMPSILLIEGLWGAGKSTLISRIRSRYPVLFIPEPNFQTSRIKKNISEWYKVQHQNRLKTALKYAQNGEQVVMERSILSNAAFHYAKRCKFPSWLNKSTLSLQSIPCLHIVLLYPDKQTFKKRVRFIKDRSVRRAIESNEHFYDNYIDFYKKIGLNVIFVKNHNSSLNKKVDSIFDKMLEKKIRSKYRERVYHCSSAVVTFKKKILILYSQRYKQFTLPQGHQKSGESSIETITREIAEETGFTDLNVIRLVRKYDFRFYINGGVTRKSVTCYLVELKSLASSEKSMETHEAYKNYIVDYDDALQKLNWPEDRENILSVQNKYRI